MQQKVVKDAICYLLEEKNGYRSKVQSVMMELFSVLINQLY